MGSASTYLHSNAAQSHLGMLTPTTLDAGAPADVTLAGGVFDTFALGMPVTAGVTIRVDWGIGTRQTMLVDTVPGTATYSDAPLLAGRSVHDPVSGATITVSSATSSGAQVAVSYDGSGSTTDTTAPSTVGSLSTSVVSGPAALVTWSPASDDSGVAAYRIWRDGTELGTTSATAFQDPDVVAGSTYTYAVAAVDTWGNVGSPVSRSVTIPTVDSRAPSAPGDLSATVDRKGHVSLSWAASSDDVAVTGYTVTREGGRKALLSTLTTLLSTSYDDRPGRGTWTYTVVATDAAGKTSAPVSVTVTT